MAASPFGMCCCSIGRSKRRKICRAVSKEKGKLSVAFPRSLWYVVLLQGGDLNGKTKTGRRRHGTKARRWPLGGSHRHRPQGKRRATVPSCVCQDAKGTAGQAAPEHRVLPRCGADRGQPDDAGPVVGSLAHRVQGGYSAAVPSRATAATSNTTSSRNWATSRSPSSPSRTSSGCTAV